MAHPLVYDARLYFVVMIVVMIAFSRESREPSPDLTETETYS